MKIQSIDKVNKEKKGRNTQEKGKENEEMKILKKKEEKSSQENADTVQFRGTLIKNQNKNNLIETKISLRCNLAAQFIKGNKERGIVSQYPNKCKKYVTKILKENFIYRRMAEKWTTSTPRPAETPDSEEEYNEFMGFEKSSGSYRNIEDEMSSIDSSFY